MLAYLEAAQATRRRVLRRGRGRHAALRRARDDATRAAASTRPRTPTASRRSRRSALTRRKGAFYVWTRRRDRRAARATTPTIVRQRFGIEPDGNAPSDPQGEFTGKNLLYTAQSIEDIVGARPGSRSRTIVDGARPRARRRCSSARATRPRPHLDDKVLTAWNGLMIAAFARAARVLPDASGRAASGSTRRAAPRRSSASTCGTSRRARLLRRYRDGDAAIDGYAEDYAYLICGLLELFQADGDPAWLEWARELQAPPGRAVLGRRGRRLVQHDRARSVGAAAAEGRLRRRRAVGELGLGPQPADAGAPDGRRGGAREGRAHARALRSARRPRRLARSR